MTAASTNPLAQGESAQGYLADPRNEGVLVYVNGNFVPRDEARVSVFDSGFVLGDGIWEGLRLVQGRIIRDEHEATYVTSSIKLPKPPVAEPPVQREGPVPLWARRGQPAPATGSQAVVDAQPATGAQPVARPATGAQPVVRPDEGVLDGVVGVGDVAEDRGAVREQPGLQPSDERREGEVVPSACTGGEDVVTGEPVHQRCAHRSDHRHGG